MNHEQPKKWRCMAYRLEYTVKNVSFSTVKFYYVADDGKNPVEGRLFSKTEPLGEYSGPIPAEFPITLDDGRKIDKGGAEVK